MDGRPIKVLTWKRGFALAGGLTFLLSVLGCMSFNFGRTEMVSPSEPNTQTGSATIPAHQTLDVYYPNPYVATPNLVVENPANDCKVVDQLPNHFRVQNPGAVPRTITWKTRGEKVPTEVLVQTAKSGLAAPSETPPAISLVEGKAR